MKRKHEYRIWAPDIHGMCNVEGIYRDNDGEDLVVLCSYEDTGGKKHGATRIDDAGLMQYIGIDDIQGVPIYEQDIVMTEFGSNPLFVSMGVVCRGKGAFYVNAEGVDYYNLTDLRMIVVGNSHEDEDLLDGHVLDPWR